MLQAPTRKAGQSKRDAHGSILESPTVSTRDRRLVGRQGKGQFQCSADGISCTSPLVGRAAGANLLPTLGKLPTVLIFPAPVPMLESYLPGWCSALINKGADIWGSRPSHSGAVILEDAPSGVLHSVIFGREGLRLRGPQQRRR